MGNNVVITLDSIFRGMPHDYKLLSLIIIIVSFETVFLYPM